MISSSQASARRNRTAPIRSDRARVEQRFRPVSFKSSIFKGWILSLVLNARTHLQEGRILPSDITSAIMQSSITRSAVRSLALRARPVACVSSSRSILDINTRCAGPIRGFQVSSLQRNEQPENFTSIAPAQKFNTNVPRTIYTGPLTKTFKYLK